ncbi:hypothetical protein HDU91_001061, partial [Kappamyces sp. JEL0680]
MNNYFLLSSQFLTQAEPAYCGLSSLTMVLNALGVDPLRQWKGVWRWYDETMLDCCRPLELVKHDGITLSEFVCLAKCNGLEAKLRLAETTDHSEFVADLELACSSEQHIMVVSYSRATLGQSGDGHFSPIGGLNQPQNKVLVLDVARFKYPTYWVDRELLWESMFPNDAATGRSRGYVLLSKPSTCRHAYSQLNVDKDSWRDLHALLFAELPRRLSVLDASATVSDFLALFIETIPPEFRSVVENRMLLYTPLDVRPESDDAIKVYVSGLENLLSKVAELELYRHLARITQRRPKGPLDLELVPSVVDGESGAGNVLSPAASRQSSFAATSRAQMERVRSFSNASHRSTISDMLPARDDLDYSTAFLSIFTLALFSLQPQLYLGVVSSGLSEAIAELVDIARI